MQTHGPRHGMKHNKLQKGYQRMPPRVGLRSHPMEYYNWRPHHAALKCNKRQNSCVAWSTSSIVILFEADTSVIKEIVWCEVIEVAAYPKTPLFLSWNYNIL